MAKQLKVMLEVGPKHKKVVAVAPDWPGLERGGQTEEVALETLRSYLPRYAKVAQSTGLQEDFAAATKLTVVERYPGIGSTDFWGISFAFSASDSRALSSQELERDLSLLQACWAYFDEVRGHVSADLQKGPRGGGRDRDLIVRHVLANEQDWAKKIGAQPPSGEVVLDTRGLKAFRADYCAAIRAFHAEGRQARTWPLRFLIRHSAYHTMDHAWEMEDKDLSGAA